MISIIIPCYNQGAYIQEAIDSVKAQTYRDWEIIIINDGSDDSVTLQKLSYLKEIGFIVIDTPNKGVSAARNTAIKIARGEFILPLDADDKIAPQYLEEAIKIMHEKAEVKLVYSDCEYFGIISGLSPVPLFSIEGMLKENLIFNSAIIRKVTVTEVSGYDETFLAGWEDWEFWLRCIKKKEEVYKIQSICYFYRIKEISRNSLIKDKRLEICEQQIYKKHIDLFLKHYPKPISLIRDFDFFENEIKKLEIYKYQLHQSYSYRLGNAILYPLKWLSRIIKK